MTERVRPGFRCHKCYHADILLEFDGYKCELSGQLVSRRFVELAVVMPEWCKPKPRYPRMQGDD